jgi:RNA-directed DNA polymerase
VYRRDVLAFAYECCKANGGAAGVDGQSFENIEEHALERWSDELAEELGVERIDRVRCGGIYPQTGRQAAALGVPTIRDRTVETAAVLVLEPIFEADLQPEQYAYRRNRSALDAVRHVHKLINTGYGEMLQIYQATLTRFRTPSF